MILYALAAFGLAYIVGHSAITFGFRMWLARRGRVGAFLVELLECPSCAGFHLGWIYWCGVRPDFVAEGPRGAVELACFTAGVNFILARATGLIGKGTEE